MGKHAEYELEREMYPGQPCRADISQRRKLVTCPDCGKECRDEAGLMQHRNAKHGENFTWADINRVKPVYE